MSYSPQKTTMDTLTKTNNENPTIYPQLLKTSSYHLAKKIFSLVQRHIIAIQLVATLTAVCIIIMLILTNLTQNPETNTESSVSPKYALSKYVAIAHATASETLPQVIMSREQMENTRREFNSRRRRVIRACKTIASKTSHLNATLMNIIVDTEHNVSWCPIYKAASSTWMNYFAMLKGTPTEVTLDLVRRNIMQVSDIVRQKFQADSDFNKTYEVSAVPLF